ncbi:MAG: histidinol dehydrogenase [Kiritimatiellaeota bacterium]|nr:histidinol dehydrogenase [Kiritimatiellota bacterium]
MKRVSYKDAAFAKKTAPLFERDAYSPEVEAQAAAIIAAVKRSGDSAVAKFAEKFDGVKLKPRDFKVSPLEIAKAAAKVSPANKKVIKEAVANVKAYAKRQIPNDWSFKPRPGVTLGERFNPLDRVGLYIPGGTAPLVSTVVHTAAVAKTAGVSEIVAATPPGPKGVVLPELLYAMKVAGVSEVYRLGGVYAIAALAFGTQSVRKVDKIIGPGNAYVAAAKKLVYGTVSIDMVAGPSEIMVVADSTADPAHVASDLLSQAEHGSGLEQAVVVSTSARLLDNIEKELKRQTAALSKSDAIRKVLAEGVFLIQARDRTHSAKIANAYAPEHLELMCADPTGFSKMVKAAGAMFIGPWTPEPVGDFVAGPSHVLPTGGMARSLSGLTVMSFMRRTSVLKYTKSALERESRGAAAFAAMEGLDAHGNSVAIRLRKK